MNYWITKECGGWWGDVPDTETSAWGVSESQQRLAKRLVPGDILLHYIDSVRAWTGYSTVKRSMEPNKRDSDGDWLDALPSVIPITCEVWLTMHESDATSKIAALQEMNFHRQNAFTPISDAFARLIIERINEAKGSGLRAGDEFQKRWQADAENYYWTIKRRQSKGKCWLCGETAASWVAKQPELKWLPESALADIGESFVDMAHITARRKKGKVSPDNIRGLCPNCHRIVDRVSDELSLEVFKRKSLSSQ